MKRQVFLFLILFLVIRSIGQNWTNINFDDSVGLNRISIDTLILSNIWQIGQPQKSVFNTAYSLPNSIITDTVNSYPSNNNSVFYLGTGGDWFMDSHTQSLNFLYRMDSDSLNDYGRIEISLDNEKDTTINYKICIGVNGREEDYTGKDVLLLEAFSIEAILFYLSKSRTPGFLDDFEDILHSQTIERRNKFINFDSYLYEIRQICYLKMQENTDLERKLLNYYESNRTNLNFRIE